MSFLWKACAALAWSKPLHCAGSIGRYDGLALDSWTRAKFAQARNNGRVANDKKILRFYSRFNSWRGLALWCDMTREWLDPQNVAKW